MSVVVRCTTRRAGPHPGGSCGGFGVAASVDDLAHAVFEAEIAVGLVGEPAEAVALLDGAAP